MSLYTFLFSYKGEVYTSQYKDDTLEAAVLHWANVELCLINKMKKKHKAVVLEEVETKYEEPTDLAMLKNVWFMGFVSGHTNMHLYIFKTQED